MQLILERATRFELATPSLGSLYSTTELCPLIDDFVKKSRLGKNDIFIDKAKRKKLQII
jgi:hypothetical protein